MGSQKKRLKRCFSGLENENGSAIVIALVILAAVTIIGIASSNYSVIELFISGNDTVKKISFFNADAGVFVIPKIISRSINDKNTPVVVFPTAPAEPPFEFNDTGVDTTLGDRTLFRELSGLEDHDTDPDIIYRNDNENNTDVDIRRLGSFSLVGGGAEFGSGAEGHGTAINGIRFMLASTGRGQKKAETTIEARYLKVIGTAGGL